MVFRESNISNEFSWAKQVSQMSQVSADFMAGRAAGEKSPTLSILTPRRPVEPPSQLVHEIRPSQAPWGAWGRPGCSGRDRTCPHKSPVREEASTKGGWGSAVSAVVTPQVSLKTNCLLKNDHATIRNAEQG